ncbi:MAG TPA: WHG domain-containing protein [Candidatus Nanopelagicaceae bacterium]|nr:WHG domain-containing protein [Candidatus Nanopelagicaceae bacterium]
MSKTAYHHGDLAAALVGAAMAEVRVVGAEKVSLRSVCAALEVSPSAAYHYFPDKDALLGATGGAVFEVFGQRMQTAFERVPGDDAQSARARLSALALAYIDFAREEPHLFRLAFGAYCVNPVGDKFLDLREAGLAGNLLVRALDDLERLGVISAEARMHGVVLCWSAVHGLATLILEGHISELAIPTLLEAIGFALSIDGKVA